MERVEGMKKIIILILFVISIFIFIVFNKRKEGFQDSLSGIYDSWYINLDRSPDRKVKVEEEVKKLGNIPIQRWTAVEGSKLTEKDFDIHSIPAWSRPSFAKDEKKRKNEIGCLLSHKTLLQNLEKLNVPQTEGHLILEDDISINKNIIGVWNKAKQSIPNDWDIIFLGLLGNQIKNVKDGIGTPEWITGAHAYVVKHSSLPKINESLRVVYDPIDEMFGRNPFGLKLYALSPSMITQNYSKSTIVENFF